MLFHIEFHTKVSLSAPCISRALRLFIESHEYASELGDDAVLPGLRAGLGACDSLASKQR